MLLPPKALSLPAMAMLLTLLAMLLNNKVAYFVQQTSLLCLTN